MNQYSDRPKVAALLRKPVQENSSAKSLNGVAEILIGGDRLVVPTMELFSRLTTKIAYLEQRIGNIENKLNHIRRGE